MKEKFIEIYKKNITRDGADNLLDYLQKTDFFTAPASTRFHLSRPGGLVEHSLNVFERLVKLCELEGRNGDGIEYSMESIAIVSLLHDICKANFYKVELRNRKNDNGVWEKYEAYAVDDQFPMGHGEKSLYMILHFMKLTNDEAMAIRWHMGWTDDSARGGSFSVGNAFGKYPLAVLTHVADVLATSIDERE